eukprot:958484-Pyramimonas_sp.AAC.1
MRRHLLRCANVCGVANGIVSQVAPRRPQRWGTGAPGGPKKHPRGPRERRRGPREARPKHV